MTTPPSGAPDQQREIRGRRRRPRRRQIVGALLAVATMAAATVAVVGGGTETAEAAEGFGTVPPPPSDTLCESDRPAYDDFLAGRNALWNNTVAVTVPVFSVDGDATSATFGDKTPYAGDYTYAVVLDNTGDPFDPDVNNHPSYHPMESSSPIVLTGGGTGSTITVDLPRNCRYVVSVRADGHDLGGSWIRIEDDNTYVANDIDMVTNDRLPLAQVVVRAFHDFAQVNAQFDIGEPGLEGFDVVLHDGGEVSVDYWENPICTNYVISGGTDPLALDEGDLDIDGQPTIDTGDPTNGNCLTDEDGFLIIQYLTAGWYELEVIPPDSSDWIQTTTIEGTRIIEAWLLPDDLGIGGEFIGDIDAGTFQAFGFVSPTLHPDPDLSYEYPFTPDAAGGDITGCTYNGQLYASATGVQTVTQNGVANPDGSSEPLLNSYVALNDVGNHDSMIDVVETDDNGCFRFVDVPLGTYQLTIWDYDLLYIIGFYNVSVDPSTMAASGDDLGAANGQVDMGDLFVLRWFGWSSGYVFYDSGITKGGAAIPASDLKDGSTQAAANGVRDCLGQAAATFDYDGADPATCEAGIPMHEVLVRDRDGSVAKSAVTDANGYYEISDIWSPMFRFQVMEVGAGSLDFTGHSTHDQFDHNLVASQGNCPTNVADILDDPSIQGATDPTLEELNCQPAELGGGLLLASIIQQGKRTEIDFGKLSYLDVNAPNGFFTGGDGHGGIAGAVVNTVTRAEWAGNLSGAEDNEPGVPSATVRLYGLDSGCTLTDPETGAALADNPDCYSLLIDELETDSYQHPGADRNGQTCTVPQRDGTPYAAINPNFSSIGDNCTGAWLLGSHTKDGAWDGGFAFTGMDPGYYVVELELPPGYQMVKENDLNTGEGNTYIPAVPPSGCVGEYHYAQLDSGYASPFDAFSDPDGSGTYDGSTSPVRLCDRRLVRVQPFRNAGVDLMVMTDGMDRTWTSNYPAVGAPVDPYSIADQSWQSVETVPMPGRFFGLVLDDLNMTADQNALTFGEQRGVAGIPIGVYDHTGNHVTTFWTDENGHYEVLLPSTYSINRPTPGGVGPQMYEFVVNDPGPTGDNWGFDGAYITNPVVLDTWPGTMTKADTPVLTLAAGVCSLPTATPQLLQVDQVFATVGSLPSDYTIDGLSLAGASVLLTPHNSNGTLDIAASIDATAYATVTTIATPSDPGSFYDEMVVDLAGLESDLATTVTPLEPGPYQVSFTTGSPLSHTPRNGITFHVLGAGYDLDVWTVPTPATADAKVIQETIDAAIADETDIDGDLVVVAPLTYRESLVVHDDVVLQGFGPGGIIGVRPEIGPIGQIETAYAIFTGTVISPFGALLDDRMYEPWETLVSGLTWDGNQGVEVGPAFQLLFEASDVTAADHLQIDGFGITTVRATNGAIFANAHADGLIISNNGIQANNASEGGAAISLGTHSRVTYEQNLGGTGGFTRVNGRIIPAAGSTGELDKIGVRSDADNDGIVIRDNRVLQNGGTALAGAVGIFNGNDDYRFVNNDVCGNYAAEYGGGLSHFGETVGGVIAGNAFQNNEAFDEGGALLIGSEISYTGPGDLGLGSGAVTVDSNRFLYNLSGDDGGAIMLLHPLDSAVRIVDNMIANNIATDLGGGIHLADSSEATIVHNTIANNVSTSSSEDAGGFACNGEVRVGFGGTNTCPRAGGLTSQPHSATFATTVSPETFSNPDLQNNIFWNNLAGVVFDGVVDVEGNLVQINVFDLPDLGVYDGIIDKSLDATPMVLNPEFSTLTLPYGAATTNVIEDPLLVREIAFESIKSQAAPGFGQVANVRQVFPPTIPIEATDHHLSSPASPATDLGLLGVEEFDIDRENRPFLGPLGDNPAPDAGADELGANTLSALMFFSTTRNVDANLGIEDIDAQSWSSTGIATVLDGAAGIGAAADIDGLHVLSDTEFLVSFLGNGVVLPGPLTVNDEDIVHYDATGDTWSLVVDGSAIGLTGGARDIDALHRLPDGTYLVSFAGRATLPTQSGTIGVPDEDIVRMVPVNSSLGVIVDAYFEPYFSGASLGLDGTRGGDIDGISLIAGGSTLLLSMKGTNTIDDIRVRDEDVIACTELIVGLDGMVRCDEDPVIYFDGVDEGLAGNNDVNAISGPLA